MVLNLEQLGRFATDKIGNGALLDKTIRDLSAITWNLVPEGVVELLHLLDGENVCM